MILRPRKFISPFSTRYDKQRADSGHCPTTQSELSTWSGVNDFAPLGGQAVCADLKEKG